jgi:hypothetical protein
MHLFSGHLPLRGALRFPSLIVVGKKRFPVFLFRVVDQVVTSHDVRIAFLERVEMIGVALRVFLQGSSLFRSCTHYQTMLHSRCHTAELLGVLSTALPFHIG